MNIIKRVLSTFLVLSLLVSLNSFMVTALAGNTEPEEPSDEFESFSFSPMFTTMSTIAPGGQLVEVINSDLHINGVKVKALDMVISFTQPGALVIATRRFVPLPDFVVLGIEAVGTMRNRHGTFGNVVMVRVNNIRVTGSGPTGDITSQDLPHGIVLYYDITNNLWRDTTDSGLTYPEGEPRFTSVSVSPGTTTVMRGETLQFTSLVHIMTSYWSPISTTWSVIGNNAPGTTISTQGLLTVASNETATTLYVRVHASNVNIFVSDYPDATGFAVVNLSGPVIDTLTLSQTEWHTKAIGDTQNITVTTSAAYWNYTIQNNTQWLTATKSGSILTLNAEPNTTSLERTAEVQVQAGSQVRTIIVSQAKAVGVMTVSQLSWDPKSEASSINMTVTTNQTSWNAISSKPWLTVVKSGSNLTLSVEENLSTTARTAEIKIISGSMTRIIPVKQAAASAMLTVNTNKWVLDYEANSTTITITTSLNSWTATCPESWLTITSSGSVLMLNAAENTTDTGRTAVVTVTAGSLKRTINVEQATSSPTTITLDGNVWNQGSIIQVSRAAWYESDSNFTIETNQATWRVISSEPWLEVVRIGSQISINTRTNLTSSSRIGEVTVSAGDQTRVIKVTQASTTQQLLSINGKAFVSTIITSSTTPTSPLGWVYFYTVETNQPSWDAISSVPWVTVVKSGSTLELYVHKNNETSSNREATVTVTAGNQERKIHVLQNGYTPVLELGYTDLSFSHTGDTLDVPIIPTFANWNIMGPLASWITYEKSSSGSLIITATPNLNETSRSTEVNVIVIYVSGILVVPIIQTINITQDGATTGGYLNLSHGNCDFASTVSSVNIDVSTNYSEWDVIIPNDVSWLTAVKSGTTFGLFAEANTTSSNRNATITVVAGSQTRTIIVTQQGVLIDSTLTVYTGEWESFGLTNWGTTTPVVQGLPAGSITYWDSQDKIMWIMGASSPGTAVVTFTQGTNIYAIELVTIKRAPLTVYVGEWES
ncbi:MAG: hypothetical protein FWD44_00005, partial [Oscillospiraceae bacterium]|nr:hypothetical protein [Oscillospiraceae bacterium]